MQQFIRKKITFFIFFTLSWLYLNTSVIFSQSISGSELLKKSMEFHDPQNHWSKKKVSFSFLETRPDGSQRKTNLKINPVKNFVEIRQKKEGHEIIYSINADEANILLDGRRFFSENDRDTFGLTQERALILRNYYTYLYGLPMKLKDPGTNINPEVIETKFQDQPVYALKVTYDPKVGADTWYFYFAKNNFQLTGYRFFHDEAKGDGEYIILDKLITIAGMNLPQIRKWYTNQDDKFLGTDKIVQ